MDSKILVVEDDEILNETLTETLEDENYDVISTFGGAEAVERCLEHSFRLVISDVRLPGSNGIETLTNIRALQPDLRCILTTGYAGPEIPSQAMQLKVDDYLVKPYSLDNLLQIVQRALGRPAFSGVDHLPGGAKILRNLEDSEAMVDLFEVRTEAFRAIFLGTKSGHLSQSLALETYLKLETLELELWNHFDNVNVDYDFLEPLRLEYIQAKTRVINLKPGEASTAEWTKTPDHIQKAISAIKNARVGLEELHYLPYLGRLDGHNVQARGVKLTLWDKVWG